MPSLRVRPFRDVDEAAAAREHEDNTRKERVGRDNLNPKP